MFGGSTLKLCYVIMSKDGRFWLHDKCWGAADATDMLDAKIYRWRWAAESDLKEINEPASIFEIGLYNGKPVMLIDAYHYWLDAKYSFAGRQKDEESKPLDDRRYMPPG